MSRLPGPQNYDQLSPLGPRTPGPLGFNDAASPFGKARLGDTPGPVGVNDGAVRMAGAVMPKARMDPPEMTLVRITREQFEAAKRECKIKADTAASYAKAWRDSQDRLGPGGDPELRRTAAMEMTLLNRQVESLVKPAAKAYAEALSHAVHAGCISLGGSFSAEESLYRLLDLECLSEQLAGNEDPFLSLKDWAGVLDKLATYVLRICRTEKNTRAIKLAVVIVHLAEGFGTADVSTSSRKEAPSKNERDAGVRGLAAYLDELFEQTAGG